MILISKEPMFLIERSQDWHPSLILTDQYEHIPGLGKADFTLQWADPRPAPWRAYEMLQP